MNAKKIRNFKKTATTPVSDWYKPTFTNRAAAQNFVLPGTIHRFVVRTEHSDLRHLTLHSVGATSRSRYFFVVRTEHSDLRQDIRQYKNSKKSKITSNSKVTVFLFFHIQKNR